MSNVDDSDRAVTDGDEEPSTAQTSDDLTNRSEEELLAQLEQMRAENQRLRREYAATQQSRYRRTSLGLYILGGLSVGAAVLFPDTRGVLFALGATGLFAGLLTYYLTPEEFVAARVSERIATAHAATLNAVIVDLGLQDTYVYVPMTDSHDEHVVDVLLFVPQATAYEPPPSPAPGIVISEDQRSRGLLTVPTGGTLLQEFERTTNQPLAEDPDRLVEQLADGITEQFELADAIRTEITTITKDSVLGIPSESEASSESRESTRMIVIIEEPLFECEMVDDPLTSFVGSGIAKGLDIPVEITERTSVEENTHRVTLEWDDSTYEETST